MLFLANILTYADITAGQSCQDPAPLNISELAMKEHYESPIVAVVSQTPWLFTCEPDTAVSWLSILKIPRIGIQPQCHKTNQRTPMFPDIFGGFLIQD